MPAATAKPAGPAAPADVELARLDGTLPWAIYLPPPEVGGPARLVRVRYRMKGPILEPTQHTGQAARFETAADARRALAAGRHELAGYNPLVVNLVTLAIG